MESLKRFGSYGFLSTMLALQLAAMPSYGKDTIEDKAKRGALDTKKSARAIKRDAKKAGRKITGQENAWEDTKDEVSDAAKNLKDETKYQAKKAKRHVRESAE